LAHEVHPQPRVFCLDDHDILVANVRPKPPLHANGWLCQNNEAVEIPNRVVRLIGIDSPEFFVESAANLLPEP
jgi:hypothetical protein